MMLNRVVLAHSLVVRVVGVVLVLGCVSDAYAESSVWRFGFYWSRTVDRYPPASVPWNMYTHVSQMAIQPTEHCGIDEQSYRTDVVKTDLVRTAHRNNVKILITLLQDARIEAIVKCTRPDQIAKFVSALAEYVDANGYDGLDLDWEAGVVPLQYQDLVRRLRVAMPDKVLTVDIAMHQRGYLIALQSILDRINLMNYDMWRGDYHGQLMRESWHHAALLSAGDREKRQTAEAGLSYLIESKIRPEKINLGVPFYGYVFRGCVAGYESGSFCSKPLSEPRQPVGGGGVEKTQIEFRQVIAVFGNAGVRWDSVHRTPYISHTGPETRNCQSALCAGDAFVTYTNEQQMTETAQFVLSRKLGGIMTFALHQEFMTEEMGDARYPLSSAIHTAIEAGGKQ